VLFSEGFSSFNILANLNCGGRGRPGHKILIPDMTPKAWEINQRVWSIKPVEYAWALVARYVLPPNAQTGQLFSVAEICEALGWTPDQYRQRVSRGRKKYQEKLFA